MRKIHICYFIGSLKIGGAQKHVVDLINNIDHRKFEVFLVLAQNEQGFLDNLKLNSSNILVLNLRCYYDVSAFKGLIKFVMFLWKNDIDILQSYLFECNVFGAICRIFKPRMKYIMSIRNMNYNHSKLRIISIHLASYFSNYVTAVSKKVRDYISKRERINQKKIKVIYNSVDHEYFSNIHTQFNHNRHDKSNINIACVSSLNFRKGHEFLIEAFQLAIKQSPMMKLYLIGDGKKRKKLKKMVSALGLQNQIYFVGYILDVRKYLKHTDIFVLSSLEEGMSNALLEAMSMGIPAITTDVGGNSEVNINGKTGFVVPPRDSSALAESLLILASDRKLREKMGRNARQRIIEKFTIQRMIENYTEFYCRDVIKCTE